MEQIKLGDTVLVLDGTANSNQVGDVGIITEVELEDNTVRVTVEGRTNAGNWMYPEQITLV